MAALLGPLALAASCKTGATRHDSALNVVVVVVVNVISHKPQFVVQSNNRCRLL